MKKDCDVAGCPLKGNFEHEHRNHPYALAGEGIKGHFVVLPPWEMPTIENLRGTMLTKSQIEKFKTEGPSPREIVALINTALELMAANEREWAWQRTATALLKTFEHAVSTLIDNPPAVIRVGEPAARFGDWINGARKVCSETRAFLTTGVIPGPIEAFDAVMADGHRAYVEGERRVTAPGCECASIMLADETRHFRGCPLREKYPTHAAERNRLVEAVDAAGFYESGDAFDKSTLWCKECKRDSGYHHDHCSKADNVRSMDARHANDQALIAVYKAALVEIVDKCQGSGALAVELAREALTPTTYHEGDPRVFRPSFVPGGQAPINPEKAEKHHVEHMNHLLEKSAVPAIHYLAGAVKHLFANAYALGMMSDEHAGRLNRLEDMMPTGYAAKDLHARIVELEKEAREFQPWRIPESPAGLLQRIEKLEVIRVADVRLDGFNKRIEQIEDFPRRVVQGEIVLDSDLRKRVEKLEKKNSPPGYPDVFTKRDSMPTIVVLCGSTRFSKAFADANLEETLKGRIVLTVGSMTHSDGELAHCTRCGKTGHPDVFGGTPCELRRPKGIDTGPDAILAGAHTIERGLSPAMKANLDELHKKKIEMADEVFVLNAMGCTVCGGVQYKGFDNWGHSNDCRHFHYQAPYPNREKGWAPYIGDSTRSEIMHAFKLKKPIRFLHKPLRYDVTHLLGNSAWDYDSSDDHIVRAT